jgi:hypothetical protein
MRFDPRTTKIGDYRPKKWRIDCLRCQRNADLDRYDMERRFGPEMTLSECAKQIAAKAGCNLAAIHGGPGCNVRVVEVAVWTWATLLDARLGKWQAYLTCQRRFASLKSADSCPEAIQLNVLTLIAALGDNFTLEKLRTKLRCPLCGTDSVEIEWFVPSEPDTPAPIQDRPPEPLRLRPRGAELARTKLGVVKG